MRTPISSEYDPVTGFGTDYVFDNTTGKVHVTRWQEVSATFDANKAEYNSSSDWNKFAGDEMHKMASIPLAVYEQWRQEGFDMLSSETDDKELRRRLNDRDFSKFRTKPGRM